MQSIPEDDDLSFSATDNVVVTSQEAIVGKRLKRGRAKKKRRNRRKMSDTPTNNDNSNDNPQNDDKKKIIEFLQSLDPSDRRISAVSSILRCCDPSARVAIIEHVQNMDPHARIGIALDFIHQELADQPNTQQNVLHRQLSSQNHDGNESSYNNEIALDVGTAGEQQATDNDTTQQQPRSLPSEDAPRAAMTNVATSGEQQVAGDDTAPRQPERMPSEDSSTSSMTESASTE